MLMSKAPSPISGRGEDYDPTLQRVSSGTRFGMLVWLEQCQKRSNGGGGADAKLQEAASSKIAEEVRQNSSL